jgi:hypothetical protein
MQQSYACEAQQNLRAGLSLWAIDHYAALSVAVTHRTYGLGHTVVSRMLVTSRTQGPISEYC